MKNPYQVCLWVTSHNGVAIQDSKRFKNLGPARKFAEKLNRKYCHETMSGRRCSKWVDIYKNGIGCVEEYTAIIVPSVGELGYW